MGSFQTHSSLVPHFETATKDEIFAVLPPKLQQPEPRDLAAEIRFTKIDNLIRERLPHSFVSDPKREAEVDRRVAELAPVLKKILADGPLQAPPMDPSLDDPNAAPPVWWSNAFPREEIVLAAARRGDRRFCEEDALWRIHLTEAYDKAGYLSGPVWAAAVPDLIYRVEMLGGYGSEGRAKIMEELRVRDGRNPAEANRVIRQAKEIILPQIVAIGESGEPWHQPHFRLLPPSPVTSGRPSGLGVLVTSSGRTQRVGSFDPVGTARLMAQYVQAHADDMGRPYAERTGLARQIRRPIWRRLRELDELRQAPEDVDSFFKNLEWQDGMNRGRNTLGEELATSIRFNRDEMLTAAYYNLARAVLMIRSGLTDLPPDPYGPGKLKFDPKRRIVWSVSRNGVDDGGRDERDTLDPGLIPPDIVFRY